MSSPLLPALQKGLSMRELVQKLQGFRYGEGSTAVTLEDRAVPYLTDRLEAWTDGPPTSAVQFVLCGADADGHHWRRWTLSKTGPWKYQLGCFPTPFNNARDPLAPGVPPTSSRRS